MGLSGFCPIATGTPGGTSSSTQDAGTRVSTSGLDMVTEYFSFVGADSQGNQLTLRLDAIPELLALADDETILGLLTLRSVTGERISL